MGSYIIYLVDFKSVVPRGNTHSKSNIDEVESYQELLVREKITSVLQLVQGTKIPWVRMIYSYVCDFY